MLNISRESISARWKNIRCFASVIRSQPAVRNAFEKQGLLTLWWRIVLALHGQPSQTPLPLAFRCCCVAEGFRFYGWLYRALAIVFGAMAFSCWLRNETVFFWVTFLVACGIYLWVVSSLAFSGAAKFHHSSGDDVCQLVAFLFFVVMFLTGTLIAICIQIHQAGWLSDRANIMFTLAALGFGIGSYFVELTALVARNSPEPLESKTK